MVSEQEQLSEGIREQIKKVKNAKYYSDMAFNVLIEQFKSQLKEVEE